MAKKEIIYMKTEEVIPYINNPRNNETAIEKVVASIQEFGFQNPIIVDKDKVIITGHTRLQASKRLKLEKVPVIIASELTEAQAKAYRLADNKIGEYAEWDMEKLQIELEALETMKFDFDVVGFSDEEISKIWDSNAGEIKDPDFDIDAELKKPAVSRYGDIWNLGPHRIMCGDSTKEEDVLKLMNGKKADMLLTDPPYNVDYTGKTKDALKVTNDKQTDENYALFLKDAFTVAEKVMKEGAVFYIWHADTESYVVRGACESVNLKVRQVLIWVKNSLVMGRQDYHWQHEPCLYGWKDGAGHLWASDRRQTTVLNFDRPSRSTEHPTMKPIALFDYQILNNTKGEDIVLDIFGGSGTTVLACEQNRRIGYLMELDPKYTDVSVRRYIELAGAENVTVERNGEILSYKEVNPGE